MSTSYEYKIVEIARKIDNLPFPSVTKEDFENWQKQLEELNDKLCCLDEI